VVLDHGTQLTLSAQDLLPEVDLETVDSLRERRDALGHELDVGPQAFGDHIEVPTSLGRDRLEAGFDTIHPLVDVIAKRIKSGLKLGIHAPMLLQRVPYGKAGTPGQARSDRRPPPAPA
jgi:hypothetical protein